MMTKRILGLAAAGLLTIGTAQAQISDDVVKIGVLSDMSGLYSDLAGQGSVIAAQMAVKDFGGTVAGKPIQIVSADHLNKPDVGSAIARQWFDQDKVDAIADVPTSSVALAVQDIAKERGKVFLISGAGSSDLTNKSCSPTGVHWTYDTYALAQGTGGALVAQGGNSWFFITADYAFGHALESDATAVIKAAGGKVLGSANVPLNTADFSSYLLQAQTSKAKVIGLANAGGDTINSIKQAAEFGIVKGGQKLAGLLVFVTDVHSIGLPLANGLFLTEAFYWDRDDASRAFAKRFGEKFGGKMPTSIQAGFYSAAKRYIEAIKEAGTDDADKVMAALKAKPFDDPVFGKSVIRQDGRNVHDMYLFEVKKPAESKGPWDYYKLIRSIPGAEAFRPMEQGECPMVKKG
jgi:branched-chain amino acid transport system substrate-binding protein